MICKSGMNVHSRKGFMKKTDKRGSILQSALRLLAEQGFHGAPMARIAEHAEVGAGTIYRYFENRDVLILAVHRMIRDELTDILLAHYPKDQSVKDCFFHIGNCIIDYFIQNPLKFQYNEQFLQ
jgi:AcrR family transcriptional regulator